MTPIATPTAPGDAPGLPRLPLYLPGPGESDQQLFLSVISPQVGWMSGRGQRTPGGRPSEAAQEGDLRSGLRVR
ncbi:unnamed protein product [Arctogadus glacialis]